MIEIGSLRDFVRKQLLFDRQADLKDDDPLFPDAIDSLGVMELVDFVEDSYGISIAEDDLLTDNFRTLRSVADMIERNRG